MTTNINMDTTELVYGHFWELSKKNCHLKNQYDKITLSCPKKDLP
jgi:hypothetical protein